MKKYILISTLLLCVLGGCSESEQQIPQEGQEALTIDAGINTSVELDKVQTTRAESAFPETSFYLYQTLNGGNIERNNANKVSGNKFTITDASNNTIYWDNIGGEGAVLSLTGLYPKTAAAPAAGSLSSFQWTVSAEQNTGSNYKNSDLLISNKLTGYTLAKQKGATTPEEQKKLQFKHVLSNITVKLVDGDGYDSEDFFPTNVTLEGMNTLADVAIDTDGVITASIAGTSSAPDIHPKQIGATNNYEAIVIPGQTLTAGDPLVKFKIAIGEANNEYTVKVPASLADFKFEQGKNHVFTITVNKLGSQVLATIVGWEDGTDIPDEVIHIVSIDNDPGNTLKGTAPEENALLYVELDGQKVKYKNVAGAWTADPVPLYLDHVKFKTGLYGEAVLVNENTSDPTPEDIYTGLSQEMDAANKYLIFEEMAHPFSKVTITIESEKSDEPNSDYVDLTELYKLELNGIKQFESINREVSSVDFRKITYSTGNATQALEIKSEDIGIESTKSYECAPLYVNPATDVKKGADYLTIYHKSGNETDGYVENKYILNAKDAINFEPNKFYNITVTLKKTEVTYAVTITGWVNDDGSHGGTGTIKD